MGQRRNHQRCSLILWHSWKRKHNIPKYRMQLKQFLEGNLKECKSWIQTNKYRRHVCMVIAEEQEQISSIKQALSKPLIVFSSVQFSGSVVSDSLQPHESQHARPPCLSPTPRVHSNSCPSSRSSVVPFSFCPQSFPASESFPMSQLFEWGGQSTGVSALGSFLTKNTQGWSPLEWTGWISLQSMGLSRVFSNTTVQKHQFFWLCYIC